MRKKRDEEINKVIDEETTRLMEMSIADAMDEIYPNDEQKLLHNAIIGVLNTTKAPPIKALITMSMIAIDVLSTMLMEYYATHKAMGIDVPTVRDPEQAVFAMMQEAVSRMAGEEKSEEEKSEDEGEKTNRSRSHLTLLQ